MARGTGRRKTGARARRWLVRIALVAGLLFLTTIPGERRATAAVGPCDRIDGRVAVATDGTETRVPAPDAGRCTGRKGGAK